MKLYNLKSLVETVNNVEVTSSKWTTAILKSRVSNFSAKISFLVIPKITGQIPSSPINKLSLKNPEDIKLADPYFNQPAEVTRRNTNGKNEFTLETTTNITMSSDEK